MEGSLTAYCTLVHRLVVQGLAVVSDVASHSLAVKADVKRADRLACVPVELKATTPPL